MAQTSAPHPKPIGDVSLGVPLTAAVARSMWGAGLGDGVIEDLTGGSLQASLITSGTVVRLSPGKALIRGTHRYENTANIDITIPTVSGAGNSRIDYLVLHYDPSVSSPTAANLITAKIVSGTAAASPVAPTLSRVEGSAGWMVPIARWTRATGGAATDLVDLRSWVGPGGPVYASALALPSDAPIGSTAVVHDGGRWIRQIVGGVAQWTTDFPLASCYLVDYITPPGRPVDAPAGPAGNFVQLLPLTTDLIRGGMTRPNSYRIGVPYAGTYRLDAQVRITCPVGTPLGGGGYAQVQARVGAAGNPANGGLVAETWDWVPPAPAGAGNITLSLFNAAINLAAGAYLELFVSVPSGGGLRIEGGQAATSVSLQANG